MYGRAYYKIVLWFVVFLFFCPSGLGDKISGAQVFEDFTIHVPPMDFDLSYDGGPLHRIYVNAGIDSKQLEIQDLGPCDSLEDAVGIAALNSSFPNTEYTYEIDDKTYDTAIATLRFTDYTDYSRIAVFVANGNGYSIELTDPDGGRISFSWLKSGWKKLLKSIVITEGRADISTPEPDVASKAIATANPDLDKTDEPIANPTPAPVYAVLEKGSKGDEVKALQQRLIELYWLTDSTADGDYGNKTKNAVERFQEAVALPITGIADQATQTRLFSNDAPEAELEIYRSSVVIGSNATTVWTVNGQEFTLRGNKTKIVKTPWGSYKFDAFGNVEKID